MQKVLVIIGLAILLTGLFWPWLVKFPIAKLPGDIIINRPGMKIYIPITSMVLAGLLINIIVWFLRK